MSILQKLFDDLQNTGNTRRELQKAVICFGQRFELCMLSATSDLYEDFNETAASATDVFHEPEDYGVWIWEGYIEDIVYPSTPDSATEYDVEYNGEYRKPTKDEWAAIMNNTCPFEDEDDS